MRCLFSYALVFFCAAIWPMAKSGAGEAACFAGDPQAPIMIEVFSDFQCPACRDFYLENVRPLLAGPAEAGEVCLIYREFPLKFHPYARQAARFALAAGRVGPDARRRVVDALYASQAAWSEDGDLEKVVSQALLEEEMLKLDVLMNDPAIESQIERDIERGRRREVQGTPSILLQTQGKVRRIPSTVQYAHLRRYLDFLAER